VDTTFDIIREVRQQGVTVLMVEQNAYAALEMADRAYLLESGEVALQGSGEELLHNPHVKAAYLGG
jgi:branched-chain amino acid transport system ATP-binding protein